MSGLAVGSINGKKIPSEKWIKSKSDNVYLNIALSINDETDQYGNNVSIFVQQTEEERNAKVPKVYIGNCKVVWTQNEKLVRATQQETKKVHTPNPTNQNNMNDLPF